MASKKLPPADPNDPSGVFESLRAALTETPETPAEHDQRVADMTPMPIDEPAESPRAREYAVDWVSEDLGERIVTEDDGELDGLVERLPAAPYEEPWERDHIIDSVAIELFVKGWPHDDIYHRAAMFLRIRDAHLTGVPYTANLPAATPPKKVQKR